MAKATRNSKPRIDLTNQTFGYLTPQYYIKGCKWHCLCKCGAELDVDTRNLRSGHTKSCGCLQKEKASENVKDMTNYEDENIKVLKRAGSDDQQVAKWECLCKHCGNIFITRGSTIRNGATQSCGCVHSLNEQKIIKLLTENNIQFITQYTFSDLKGVRGGHLRFDFAIFKDGKLSHLIDFNGLQHYQKTSGGWGQEYEILIQNDERKKEYCLKNNIELRIIRYDQDYSLKDLI